MLMPVYKATVGLMAYQAITYNNYDFFSAFI